MSISLRPSVLANGHRATLMSYIFSHLKIPSSLDSCSVLSEEGTQVNLFRTSAETARTVRVDYLLNLHEPKSLHCTVSGLELWLTWCYLCSTNERNWINEIEWIHAQHVYEDERHNYGFMASSVSHWFSELETSDLILAGTLVEFCDVIIIFEFWFFLFFDLLNVFEFSSPFHWNTQYCDLYF